MANEKAARFSGFVQNFSTTKLGDIYIGIVVPLHDKYDALPITDQPGMMFEFVVTEPDYGDTEIEFDPWQMVDLEDSYDRFGVHNLPAGILGGRASQVRKAAALKVVPNAD